jgi:tRNA (cytidine/uridine-2'-O-)-methyltransferase
MRLALFQPEIPQNTGTLLRLSACLNVSIDIIEPCGFVISDKNLKRAGMDYIQQAHLNRHSSWQVFLTSLQTQTPSPRLVLLTPHTSTNYTDFTFQQDDILMVGRESNGVPPEVFNACQAHVKIPMTPGSRSINMALSAAMVLGEALRQTHQFPPRS